ncbi:hypothetical protein HSB1_37610 [Halogranum salarium B-1]|uniref:Uncharacterized protein n=1 Tax=Halogranum salarium B-1 TaxID=1210908 RepID=J3JEG6_9EURY|nr:hypothetical protein HSB1_37610 [Halogranum salarium B-1]
MGEALLLDAKDVQQVRALDLPKGKWLATRGRGRHGPTLALHR